MRFWPFKRRKIKNNEVSSSFAQANTTKTSLASILGSFITAFIILGAGATGIGISAWKQTLGSEFGKSYNIRFELDPNDEQSYGDPASGKSRDSYADLAKKSADAYSQFLHKKGIDYVDVYPEWIPDPAYPANPDLGQIFINAVVPNDHYQNKLEDKRLEIPKPDIFMNYQDSSRLTALIQVSTGTEHKLAVIPLNQYIDNNQAPKVNSKNPLEVDVRLNASFETIVDSYLDNTGASSSNDDSTKETQIFIIQNYYGLLNYLTFILQDYYIYGASDRADPNLNDAIDVRNYLENSGTSEKAFSDKYKADHGASAGDAFLGTTQLWNYAYYHTDDNGGKLEINSQVAQQVNKGLQSDAPLYFESTLSATDQTWSPSGSINYDFLKKYILAFGQPDKKDATADTYATNSFLKIVPNKNPTNTKEDSNWQWLTINSTDRYQAQNLAQSLTDFTFPVPVKAITGTGYDKTTNDSLFTNIENNTNTIENTLDNNVFGLKPIIGLICSIALIVLGIGIIVSLLYRVPGLFGFVTIIGAFGLTLMILILSNYTISLGMFFGLLVGVLGAFLSTFNWCSRIKKLHQSGFLFDVAVRKGVKNGLLPSIDIHMVMLLIGICISYFGANQIHAFGNALLIFSMISFALSALAWMLMVLFLFNNKIGFKNIHWFFKNKKPSMVTVVDNKKYETSFGGQFAPKRFSVFGLKQIICASIVALVILVGILLVTVVGVHSSYTFYGGSRLIMSNATYISHTNLFEGYSNIVRSNNLVYLYYDHTLNTSTWAAGGIQFAGDPTTAGWVSVQSISSAGTMDYITSTINTMLIVSGLISVYAFVRLNWVSIIPVFLGLVLVPMLAIGLIGIFQIYFDIYIILSIVVIYAINAIFVIHFVGVLNNQWTRKQIFGPQDLRKIFNTEIKNSLIFYAYAYGVVIGSLVIALLLNSTTLIWFSLIIIVGLIASLAIMYSVIPICLYLFIRLRYRYLSSNNFENPLLRKNYDVVDEQLIDGINKFKRQKPTL